MSHMDHVAAATSLPSWNAVPSLRAELGARLPGGWRKEGVVNPSLFPLRMRGAGA